MPSAEGVQRHPATTPGGHSRSGEAIVRRRAPVTSSDSELIERCLAGETDAFGVLVERYQDRLFNTLLRSAGSPEAASEIAQQAFVRAFHKLESFQGRSAFYSWLFRIAMNALISSKRRERRQGASLDRVRETSGEEPLDNRRESLPSHQMELSEDQRLVRRALDELSEEYRTCLVLKEIEGLKYEEIADIVGCPVGTVRSRIHRARHELREKLERLLQR